MGGKTRNAVQGSDETAASPGRVRQRFEQWSANPRCGANVLSAVSNVRMDRVAERMGVKSTMGQSPFAIAAGNNFERTIFRDGAMRLRDELAKAGVIAPESTSFTDFRTRDKGGPQPGPDAAERASMEFLAQLATTTPARGKDLIVAGATITVPDAAMLPRTRLGIDVLLVRASGADEARALPWHLVIGEVKSHVDRGGYTDRTKLAGARAQAGVYVAGLRAVLAAMGIGPDRMVVDPAGFLVFVRAGGRHPVVYPREDFSGQAQRAEEGFARMRAIAKTQPKLGDDGIRAVIEAPRSFTPACTSFCDLASRCQREAWERGDPRVLGEDMARFTGPVDLHRAHAILEGAEPLNPAELDLQRRIAALAELRNR